MSDEKAAKKPSVTRETVTSETLSEFVGKKLNLEPEDKKQPDLASEPTKESTKEEAKKEVTKEEIKENKDEKKKNPVQPRINELVSERNYERARREELEKELEVLKSRKDSVKKDSIDPPQEDQEPLPAQFSDAFEYAKALADWSSEKAVKKAIAERENKLNKDRELENEKAIIEAWQSRQNDIRQEYADYDEVVGSSDIKIRSDIQQAVLESDIGPWLVYHFAQNPDVLHKLNEMSFTKALRECGKLEATLSKSAQSVAKSEPSPDTKISASSVMKPEKSKAPAPIQPLKDSNESVDKPRDQMSYQEWKANRRAGKIH